MTYGYIRVSTDKQDCENQKIGIEAKAKILGLSIEKYIEDSGVSGATEPDDRALGGCLKKLRDGDVLICSELSRLGRKLFMIMRILEHCMNSGAKVYTIKDGYELGDNLQSKVLAFAFAISAEIERDLISMRTKEALAARKAAGFALGRPAGSKNKKLKLAGAEAAIEAMLRNGVAKTRIARKYKVSVPTLYGFIAARSHKILTKV
ncbi:MAG: recombinase family protein [Rickettsiales bacterium]|jgi:DNA invertase Pin-like site-specific DNA recombinase|nr:recombinase family protein [Rickettsiales bacterium]